LLGKIFKGLRPGGCLLLTEKVLGDTPELDSAFVEIHHRFKRERGYSELEISRKREALENVLTPLKLHENIALLKQAGFRNVDIFFKWNNFAGLIALP
jgi:tRNA (cmo5U34)-methyltransferase